MLKFLNKLPAPTAKTLFVVGNQSADMDSCCSALVTSFFYKHPSFDSVQPYIDIPRGDLKLRPDISWLFKELEIPLEKIVFKDDHNEFFGLPTTPLFLVDHNSPTVPGKVWAIIDHHQPEGASIETEGPNIIGTSGSCMSWIIDNFKTQDGWSDKTVAALAMSPIMQDTRNLTQRDKVERVDMTSYQYVSQFFPFEIKATVEILKERKKDLNGFSAMDVLKKDYKQWGDVGISSLPSLFDELLKQWPDFGHAMEQFKKETGLKEYLGLASGKRNKWTYVRELAIVGNDLDVQKSMPGLQLKPKQSLGTVVVFEQGDSTANRKVVAPLLRKLCHQEA